MKTQKFTRRWAATLVAALGIAASQAAYASPPDPTPLKAFDSGQQLLQKEFVQDTGQATIVATAVTEKVIIGTAANTARIKELDTSPQLDITAATIVNLAIGTAANTARIKELDTSPPIGDQRSINVVATIVNPTIGTAANTARIKELDTSPPIGGQLAIISGALGIDANLDTGQPTAGYAGYQVQALSA